MLRTGDLFGRRQERMCADLAAWHTHLPTLCAGVRCASPRKSRKGAGDGVRHDFPAIGCLQSTPRAYQTADSPDIAIPAGPTERADVIQRVGALLRSSLY